MHYTNFSEPFLRGVSLCLNTALHWRILQAFCNCPQRCLLPGRSFLSYENRQPEYFYEKLNLCGLWQTPGGQPAQLHTHQKVFRTPLLDNSVSFSVPSTLESPRMEGYESGLKARDLSEVGFAHCPSSRSRGSLGFRDFHLPHSRYSKSNDTEFPWALCDTPFHPHSTRLKNKHTEGPLLACENSF